MSCPKVAIVGRPNVGKSSLFNALAGRRIAIVEPTAGVTRDRLSTLIEAQGRFFELLDTGGMGIQDVDNLTRQVEAQIDAAVAEAALVLFVVDARDGPVPLDEHVAARLRGLDKPVLLVANKCDTAEFEVPAQEFHQLGWGAPLCVSAHQGRNRSLLVERILERLPIEAEESAGPVTVDLKLAIVGRRNTGKSTFINRLAQAERVIVSEVPGTTRDSVDVRFERDGRTIIAIDTAGVRKKSSIANSIEFYSLARAERSIRRADVVLLFLDPRGTVSRVDKQLAEYVVEQHKPLIFVVNKWDLMRAEGMPTGRWGEYLRKIFPHMDHVPIAFISARSNKNVQRVLNLAQNLQKQALARVSTSELNRVVQEAVTRRPPPMRKNRSPRVYFATQAAVNPPTIVLFTNGPDLFDEPYRRYLLKTFHDELPFAEVPIQLYMRQKGEANPEALLSAGEKKRTAPAAKNRRASLKPDVWRDL